MKVFLLNTIDFTGGRRLLGWTGGVLLVLLFLSFSLTSIAQAASYGEGAYGGGTYNIGEISGGTSSLSPADAPSCTQTPPGNPAPQLYAAVPRSSSSIELFFTDSQEPYDTYAVEYGTEVGRYRFAAGGVAGHGTRSVLIQALSPNTRYYFRIRAGNGCATGPWSNEISATTQSRVGAIVDLSTPLMTNITDVTADSLQSTKETEQISQPLDDKRYQLKVLVVDRDQQHVQGANVTLHSEPMQATTNEEGIASFDDVTAGEHRLLIAYDGYQGEEVITLIGEVGTIAVRVQIERIQPFSSPAVILAITGLLTVIAVLVAVVVRYRRKDRP